MIKKPLAVLLILFGVVSCAQSVYASSQAGTRPNDGGPPDEITVRLGLLDIVEIKDREQEFVADMVLQIEWHDPRLADEEAHAGLRRQPLDSIWNPRLTIVNDRGLDMLFPDVVTIDSQGNVIVRQRVSGPLGANFDLREFPFDTQHLQVDVVSYEYSPAEIRFSADSEMVARVEGLNDELWTFVPLQTEAFEYRLKQGGNAAAGLAFSVRAERDAKYYIFTLVLPLTLILFLAWVAHWLPVGVIPARMSTTSAAVFSLITFGIGFRLTLPKIAYFTIADRFVLYSTLLVFISLAVIVLTIWWANNDREEAAERLARLARAVFPILYGVILGLTILL